MSLDRPCQQPTRGSHLPSPPRSIQKVGAAAALALLLCGVAGDARAEESAGGSGAEERCAARFHVAAVLSRPTQHSITVSAIAAEDLALRVAFGADAARLDRHSAIRVAAAGERVDFVLEELQPGTRYAYRVECRASTADGAAFRPRPASHFTTLRAPGADFRFAVGADSHVFKWWANAQCGARGDNPRYRSFPISLANIVSRNLDFFITVGDEVMTHCKNCPACLVDGESTGVDSVKSEREADLRYRQYLSLFGPLVRQLPYFVALGNHDGETSYASPDSPCLHFPNVNPDSEAARLRALPNPGEVYPTPSATGNYYAFESGDALFVVLDTFKDTGEAHPQSADDWTLGKEQLAWLEKTLRGSERRWKLLFSHHLVGGVKPEQNPCYHYGRGGLRSTEDGTPRGRFLGEQAQVHDLMREHGAQAFVYGHDHVAVVGEKQGAEGRGEGVHYILAGQLSGAVPSWSTRKEYQREMDWNEDGVADYLEDPPTRGVRTRGFFEVRVEGTRALHFSYIRTDPDDPARNNRPVFEYRIDGK